MRYLPLSPEERSRILKLIGADSFEAIVEQIPEPLRLDKLLDLDPALDEESLLEHLGSLAKKNDAKGKLCFLGQGAYDHSWPRVIDQIVNRGEFLTAYTPYQPELSQGTLTSIFEFQSMIAELTGMEVANASLYDGATATVEAVLMAARLGRRTNGKVLVSEGTYDGIKAVLKSYLDPLGFEIIQWNADPESLCSKAELFDSGEGDKPLAVVMQSPNKWGLIEDWAEAAKIKAEFSSTTIAHIAHPHSLALFEAPGEHDIDICSGEGQALGIPLSFGGPYLGLFACKKKDVRQMPGRLVGKTQDASGERAFCVTLATREQHIRREKATSSICSNQNLMALRASIYMALMGPQGLEKVARISRSKAYFARKLLKELIGDEKGLKVHEGEAFNEVALLIGPNKTLWAEEALRRIEEAGIVGGYLNSVPSSSGYVKALCLAFTERHKKEDIKHLCQTLTGNSLPIERTKNLSDKDDETV